MTDLFEPWLIFKHPIVRQLAFAIASPNILRQIPEHLAVTHCFESHDNDFWQQQFKHYQHRLIQLDQQPDELTAFLAQLKSTRLGLRFEYLIWFWLQDSQYHHFEIIGHSIQIIQGKNTIGELDFLVLNKRTMQVEHWEVALKFYLAEARLELAEWYGLNRSDTLLRKLNHFTQKQFQFETITQHGLKHRIDRKFAVLKGQLYLPRPLSKTNIKVTSGHTDNSQHRLPDWINPARRLGTWSHQVHAHFYRLERQEWICSNQKQSTPDANWWYNGLYRNFFTREDFMFRQAEYTISTVKIM